MEAATPVPSVPLPSTADEVIATRLRKFRVLPQRWLHLLLALSPALILLWFAGGMLRLTAQQQPDYFIISAFVCLAADLFILRVIFDSMPQTLLTLWTRQLFDATGEEQPVEADFQVYLTRFEAALRHPMIHALGAFFALFAITTTYYVLGALRSGVSPFNPDILSHLVSGLRILYLPIGYFVGVLAWKAGVIAFFIYRLGTHFKLKIQSNHPDHCGGLKPLGDLCLLIALLLLLPAIYYSIWGFITAMNSDPSQQTYTLWAAPFRLVLFVLILLTFLAFFLPMYSIHLQMAQRRQEILDELDRLSQAMDSIQVELRAQATSVTPQQGEDKLNSVKFMQKVYEENMNIPIWPFEWRTLVRFGAAQVMPVLTLAGTSGPILELIQNLLKPLGI